MVNETIIDKVGFLGSIGETVSSWFTDIIQFVSNLGLNIDSTTGKILSIVILLGIAWGIVKLIEKPVKWAFIIGIIVLIISIIISLVG